MTGRHFIEVKALWHQALPIKWGRLVCLPHSDSGVLDPSEDFYLGDSTNSASITSSLSLFCSEA